MLAYGFDVAERDGVLRFRMRDGQAAATVGPDQLAVGEETDGWVETARATEAEIAGRVRLSYVEAEGDYEARAVEAIFPDEETRGVAQSEMVPIYHQFHRDYMPGASYGGSPILPTPLWPSHTDQFGVYPVRGPW